MKKNRSRNYHYLLAVILIVLSLVISISLGESASWDCPECGEKGNIGNYCGGCAHPSPWLEDGRKQQRNSKKDFQTVGNIVKFGHYEQDNNLDNGKEEIEWIVLDVQNGKSLLLSKLILDCKQYNDRSDEVTWETCTLRKWLNREFLETAFSEKERMSISTTKVDNSASQGLEWTAANGGRNTQDKIFLLSYKEAFELYFGGEEERKSVVTDYAIAHGEPVIASILKSMGEEKTTGWWWLRSPGMFHQASAALVTSDGKLTFDNVASTFFDIAYGSVRPAFWINLESEIF